MIDRDHIKAVIMKQGYYPEFVKAGEYPLKSSKVETVVVEKEVFEALDKVAAMSDEELAWRVRELMEGEEDPEPAPKPRPRPRKPRVSSETFAIRLYSDGYRGNEAIMVRRSKQGGNQ